MRTISVLFVLFIATSVNASPVRSVFLLHGQADIGHELVLRGDLLPLLGETTIELGGLGPKWLEIAPALGLDFPSGEAIVSLRLSPIYEKFWGWVDLEFRPTSSASYLYAQLEWEAAAWIHVGLEGESWGSFSDIASFSHGLGPNALVKLGDHARFDFSYQFRRENGAWQQEVVFRGHFYF